MADGYGGSKVCNSTYLLFWVLIVAVVPKLMQALSGVRHPAPMMSHALSLEAATNGRPLGMPVCAAAPP